MNNEKIDHFKEKLLHLQTELKDKEDIFQENKGPVELDQAKQGRLSRMDAMQSQQMELEESRRRQHQLLKIEGALRRIQSDEFGYCFVCGEEIDERRLNFDLTNTRCITCVDKELP